MKSFCVLFFLLISLSAKAANFVKITLTDKSKFVGEVVEVYEDRWFWEVQGTEVEKNLLLFKVHKGKPIFKFIDFKEIKKVRLLGHFKSNYKAYLKKHNIIFQNHLVKNSVVLTGNEGHHKFEKMFGNFAWDIGIADKNNKQYKEDGLKLKDYYIFDKDVVSPIRGTVVGKVSDEYDNVPSPNFVGDLARKKNNYLTIKIQGPFYLSIVHFKENSITVNIGDSIKPGQSLGKVGNSGVSYIPHLHYTLYIYLPSRERFISVPGYFK